MAIISEPAIHLIGRQQVDDAAVRQFLDDHGTSWETDSEVGGELLSELGGRVCYMAFGAKQGRRTNGEYLENILRQRHGSVLEHAVWTFVITGVSRSLTHELIRHRAGFGYCLTGDTLIYSDHHVNGRKERTKKRRLADLYAMSQTPHGRSRIKLLRLRCLDEQTGTFTTGRVARIAATGRKAVFRIQLEDGKAIQCSRDHRFLTAHGWSSLDTIVGGIEVSPGGHAVCGSLETPIAVNGTPAYKSREWLEQQYLANNLEQVEIARLAGVSKHTIRAWVRRYNLQKPLGSWTVGRPPWNKGKIYRAGWTHSLETNARLRAHKIGSGNPQWRGGITRQAVQMRSGMKELRPLVLARDGYFCRLCGVNTSNLQVHHVMPIWARPDLRYDLGNLVTICGPCHHKVNGHELEYLAAFGAAPEQICELKATKPPRAVRMLAPKFQRIVSVTYAGEQDTYDIEMEGPQHSFVANGIVTHNSQLSQRYVDEAETDFVEPGIIAGDPRLHDLWLEAIEASRRSYVALSDALTEKLKHEQPELKATARRKAARQAARSVLPNATETKIVVTANGRALRHFIELRGGEDAEPEIRALAVGFLHIMQREAPNMFADFSLRALPDGSQATEVVHGKV